MPTKAQAQTLLILVSVCLLVYGFNTLDWMVVGYRYLEWHRSVDYWELCPYVKMPWWIAYVSGILALLMGAFLLGVLTSHAPPKA